MSGGPSALVLPAAGLGTRMKRIDPRTPKEMLPLGGKPAIQYAVEEGIAAGISRTILIISAQKEMIRRYFEDRVFRRRMFPDGADVLDKALSGHTMTFLYQDSPLGEMDALSLARDEVGTDAFALIYPDNIYLPGPGALSALSTAFLKYRSDVAALMEVTERNAAGTGNSGRVDLEPIRNDVYRILRFHPKGPGHFVPRFPRELRTCGIMITTPSLFSYIDRVRPSIREGEEFTDGPVRAMMLEEQGLIGCRLPGTVFDVGNPQGYALCRDYLSKS